MMTQSMTYRAAADRLAEERNVSPDVALSMVKTATQRLSIPVSYDHKAETWTFPQAEYSTISDDLREGSAARTGGRN